MTETLTSLFGGDLHVILILLEICLAIAVCSIVFDRVLIETLNEKPISTTSKDDYFFLFGFLPAVDSNLDAISGSELIKVSAGFCVTIGLSLLIASIIYGPLKYF